MRGFTHPYTRKGMQGPGPDRLCCQRRSEGTCIKAKVHASKDDIGQRLLMASAARGKAGEQGPWVLTNKPVLQRAWPCYLPTNMQGPWARLNRSTVHTRSRVQASTGPWAHMG